MKTQWDKVRYGTPLSYSQLNALHIINEDKCIPEDDPRIHGNTLNSLERRYYIFLCMYPNGWHYRLTDKGLEYLDKESKGWKS